MKIKKRYPIAIFVYVVVLVGAGLGSYFWYSPQEVNQVYHNASGSIELVAKQTARITFEQPKPTVIKLETKSNDIYVALQNNRETISGKLDKWGQYSDVSDIRSRQIRMTIAFDDVKLRLSGQGLVVYYHYANTGHQFLSVVLPLLGTLMATSIFLYAAEDILDIW